MAKVELMGYRCQRCSHEWFPRDKDQEPKVCPKCKSPYWASRRKDAWTQTFTAGVQYGDWRGTVAADDVNVTALGESLRKKGLISTSEFLVGLELSRFERDTLRGASKIDWPVYISAFVIEAANYDEAKAYIETNNPIRCRKVRLDLTFDKFMALFKRFNLTLGRRDLGLIGREYLAQENDSE